MKFYTYKSGSGYRYIDTEDGDCWAKFGADRDGVPNPLYVAIVTGLFAGGHSLYDEDAKHHVFGQLHELIEDANA